MSAVRKRMIEDGAFDGRFRSKVIKDKKKESLKNTCRKKVKPDDA